MRNSKFRWILALLAVFALVAAACGDDDDSDDSPTSTVADGGDEGDGGEGDEGEGDEGDGGDEGATGASVDGVLKLGALLPQTGDLAQFGPGMLGGVQLAVDDINAAGGVLGADVELVEADSASDPDQANQAAEQFINNDNVDAIMGAAASGVTLLGVIEPTVGAGRLECSGSNTTPELATYDDNGLYFRTAPSDSLQSVVLGDAIAADGYTNVAIIFRSDDYGQAFAELTEQQLESVGITVADSIGYNQDNPDFDADAQALAAIEGLEAIVAISFPEDGAALLNALIEQGVGPKDVPHYYTDGLASDDLAAAIDADDPTVIDGAKGTRPGAAEGGADVAEAFATRLADAKGVEETTFASNFYDCAITTALAAVVAETDDPVAMAAVLQDVTSGGEKCNSFADCLALHEAGTDFDYDGVTGFDLDENGEVATATYEYWEFVDGAMSVIDTTTLGA